MSMKEKNGRKKTRENLFAFNPTPQKRKDGLNELNRYPSNGPKVYPLGVKIDKF